MSKFSMKLRRQSVAQQKLANQDLDVKEMRNLSTRVTSWHVIGGHANSKPNAVKFKLERERPTLVLHQSEASRARVGGVPGIAYKT